MTVTSNKGFAMQVHWTILTAAILALGTHGLLAQTIIFDADFEGTASDGAATLGNLDNGTTTGSWSGARHNSLLDTDSGNRGALFERGNLNLNADFASPGSLTNGVTISAEASPRRINGSNPGRFGLIKGVASDNTVLFVLGISGDSGGSDPGHERLSYFNVDFNGDTGGGSAGFPAGVTPTFVGSIGNFPVEQNNTYAVANMTPFELILGESDFDIVIDGALAATDIPYLSPASDIASLNFQTDFNGGTWFDNFLVVEQEAIAIPEPTSVSTWLILGVGVAGFSYRRVRRKK